MDTRGAGADLLSDETGAQVVAQGDQRIVKSRTPARARVRPSEDAFQRDLFFHFQDAKERHANEAAKLACHVHHNRTADHSAAETFTKALETEAYRFIEAVSPSYERAFRDRPKRKDELRKQWWLMTRDLITAMEEEYSGLEWFDDGVYLEQAILLATVRVAERYESEARQVEMKPHPSWSERHPLLRESIVAAVGAVIGSGITLLAQFASG